MTAATLVGGALYLAMALVLAGAACSFVRLVRGPTMADRVVALDLLSVLAVAFIGIYAILSDAAAFVDVAIALALVGFLATVAFARYADQRTEAGAAVEDLDE
jgi:multicomponent Na+:H+ antiporter subunit F